MSRYLMFYKLKGCIEIDAHDKDEAVDKLYDMSTQDLGSRCDDCEIIEIEKSEDE